MASDPVECKSVRFWPIVHAHTCVHPLYVRPPPAAVGGTGTGCDGRSTDGQIMTLYHQTSCEIGPLILDGGFHLGRSGWCGGGIYFATTPKATESKAIGQDSHQGFMIEAQVMVGKLGRGDRHCKIDGHVLVGEKLHEAGFDSATFNPGDGDEYVVYCSSQVVSVKHIPYGQRC
eukprot:TRINITY_DN4053_c0_g1_i1.p1 TRINITY_DN4053_c0_g1~~TRINITY_DN4053_c0_g1_i1.p1  ORF type:complete len:174 (+),score=23.62 TRINITY_DN4053_c0_g1_i1:605-1126(+)